MPHFISKEGMWEPAKEYVVDSQAPKGKEIYEGPDREAVKMLEESGGTLGHHYSADMELMQRARQMGFSSIEEYLRVAGYDKKKAEAKYEEAKAQVIDHKDPQKVKPEAVIGGGFDTSGQGRSRYGGFEHPADVPAGFAKPNADVPKGAPLAPRT